MRTISTEFRAAAARQQRDAAAKRTRGKRQRPAPGLSVAKSHRGKGSASRSEDLRDSRPPHRAVRLAPSAGSQLPARRDQEVRVRTEQLGQFRRRQADEPDACSARPNPIRPRCFISMSTSELSTIATSASTISPRDHRTSWPYCARILTDTRGARSERRASAASDLPSPESHGKRAAVENHSRRRRCPSTRRHLWRANPPTEHAWMSPSGTNRDT